MCIVINLYNWNGNGDLVCYKNLANYFMDSLAVDNIVTYRYIDSTSLFTI